ncbi:SoxR reducing system RseC family protein [Dysgonomonas sp. 511]|uniref:SoxR reducing system RseC family protein n=1 Tax=Dysgonomonas sp. 511 TaxID=2302930 RepID=UPI0013CFD939|nr:SoxR reducing system RseC family protein [Dysgonomonas sp. 511]NDV77653.1 hypothetical protein [Dysgonomonas sp. 511]
MLNNHEERDDNFRSLFEELKQELKGYVNSRLRLFQLTSYEKLSISASKIGYGLIVFLIVAIILFFIFLGMAFFLGELLGSLAAGFGIMALLSLVALFVVYLLRRTIKRSILNHTIIFIRKVEANEE